MITVFTPTYNRAHLLPRLYESLCRQTSRDFEWVIVDDGSQDNTKEIVSELLSKDIDFRIRYIFKDNGGKHTAINRGVKDAKGELFLILDSDDSLPQNAVADIIEQYQDVSKDPYICGVSGLMAHHNGILIGTGYPNECKIASSIEQRYKYGVKGDLIEVFKTSILREFSFPEIKTEKFCTEDIVLNRISVKYKMKCFNKIVYYRDYIDGGLTDNIVKIRMNSPIATTTYYSELITYDIPLVQLLKAAINYWRFWFCLKDKASSKRIPIIYMPLFPVGLVMHIMDKRKVKK